MGKRILVGIFCMLRAVDVLIYFGTPPGDKSRLLASLIVSAIWTTVLLAAIWHRHNWARYATIFLLLMGVVSYIVFVPDIFERSRMNHSLLVVFIASGLTNAAVAWCLGSSRNIRRLTSRSYA